MLKKLFVTFLLCGLSMHAFAEGKIIPLKTDSRIKMVSFNPNQIYSIKTHFLVSTDMCLEKMKS